MAHERHLVGETADSSFSVPAIYAATRIEPTRPPERTDLSMLARVVRPHASVRLTKELAFEHLRHTAEPTDPAHPSRAPPQGDLLV